MAPIRDNQRENGKVICVFTCLKIKAHSRNYFSDYSNETYVVGTQKNRLYGDGSFVHPNHM